MRLCSAQVASQGLKQAANDVKPAPKSGLSRLQVTWCSTSGCAGLANGVLQTFPKANLRLRRIKSDSLLLVTTADQIVCKRYCHAANILGAGWEYFRAEGSYAGIPFARRV